MGTSATSVLGVIGTGSITSAVVEGFCTSEAPCRILLSPRNEAKGRALAERFVQVTRAGSNQEVLDRSDIVLLGVRPGVAPGILQQLRFRPEHTVLSFIPVIPLATLGGLVGPARRVFKVLPLPYVARHLGLVPFFPADGELPGLLRALGTPMPVGNERELHLLWAITGLISPFYAQMQLLHEWCVAGGADPAVSQRYTASMYASLASLAEGDGAPGFAALAAHAATPGGMNEMALALTRAGDTFPDLRRALDRILERFGETPVLGGPEA